MFAPFEVNALFLLIIFSVAIIFDLIGLSIGLRNSPYEKLLKEAGYIEYVLNPKTGKIEKVNHPLPVKIKNNNNA